MAWDRRANHRPWDRPVSQIHSGAGPWTTRGGSARINLATGSGSFEVEGLVLNGGNASGTPGSVTTVVGTLVCNPGSPAGTVEAVIDTPTANLSASGDAELSFKINVPPTCNNPRFLIRVPPAGRWIALARSLSVAWNPLLDSGGLRQKRRSLASSVAHRW